ncbi:MAG TPA: hypothetical protein VFS20_17455 [Longimicrobium sp.]|nr:hypothetical protein [Longimicrobium sp.]
MHLPVDEAAASVALLALRAALPEGTRLPRRFMILPDGEPLDRAQAVARLVTVPKPVECEVKVLGGAVAVRWNSIADDPTFTRVIFARMEEPYRSAGVRRVLFLGRDDAVLVTVEAALRLDRDYNLHVNQTGGPTGDWSHPRLVTEIAERAGADFIHTCHETRTRFESWL